MSLERGLNLVLYEAGWFAVVLGAGSGRAGSGAAIAGLLVLGHVALAVRRRDEALLALGAAVGGFCVDSALASGGLLLFDPGPRAGIVLPPVWIALLWAQFATLLRFSLAGLARRPGLAAALGLVGGPLAFLAGARLGAVRLHPELWPSLVALGAVWAVAMPLLATLAGRGLARPGAGRYRGFRGNQGTKALVRST